MEKKHNYNIKETMRELDDKRRFIGEVRDKINTLVNEGKIHSPCGNGCPWPWCLDSNGKCTE